MGVFDKLFEYAQDVVMLTREVQDVGQQVVKMEDRWLDRWMELDRRITWVEASLDLAREQARNRALRRED